MFSLLWESWNFTHIIFVEETLTTQFTVMESTKLKTQQNALLASREHKQSPATIQDLKWPGKYKARNCCCMSTSGSAPFPSSQAWCGEGKGGGSPAWTWNTRCLLAWQGCLEDQAAQLLAECFWGFCTSQHHTVKMLGQTESITHLRRGEFDTSVSCKCSGKHAQGFLETPYTWGNIKPLLGTP